jgi:hypothetical protein
MQHVETDKAKKQKITMAQVNASQSEKKQEQARNKAEKKEERQAKQAEAT